MKAHPVLAALATCARVDAFVRQTSALWSTGRITPPLLASTGGCRSSFRAKGGTAVMVIAPKPIELSEASSSADSASSTPESGGDYRLLDVGRASESWNSLPEMWDFLDRECGSLTALVDPIHPTTDDPGAGNGKGTQLTYGEVRRDVENMAGALSRLGLNREDCVSVFSENSARWLIAEQGIMKAGGCNAVRGATAPVSELRYVYKDSDSVGVVVETTKMLESLMGDDGEGLASANGTLPRFVVILFSEGSSGDQLQESMGIPKSIKVVTYMECLAMGGVFDPPTMDPSMKATLVYTSGTTGYPKGAVLTHKNLLHQIACNSFDRSEGQPLDPWVGDVFVSILPCWHIFERTAEYFMVSRGVTMVYSNVRNFKSDLKEYRPHFLIVVPRLLETIWKGVQTQLAAKSKGAQKAAGALTAISAVRMRAGRVFRKDVIRDSVPGKGERALSVAMMTLMVPLKLAADKLVWSKIREGVGGRVKIVVSGGSSLPSFLEDFFEMAGIRVVVGYGLTETSPVISNRVAADNVRGTVGKPAPGTEVKIVDQETGTKVPLGTTGKILIRGPQVMTGYQNNPSATAAVIDKDGFFDTGDLGRFNLVNGDLIVTGRAKDTIVLSNGENVEPQPIEDVISGDCSLVDQVMLFGQDERFLGAIICLNPRALAACGLISQEDGDRYATLLGPTPLTTGPAATPEKIAQAEKELVNAAGVKEAVMKQLKAVAPEERPWEQVGGVILKFEPFTTSNGLITQTLKTRRDVVAGQFSGEIEALYAAKR